MRSIRAGIEMPGAGWPGPSVRSICTFARHFAGVIHPRLADLDEARLGLHRQPVARLLPGADDDLETPVGGSICMILRLEVAGGVEAAGTTVVFPPGTRKPR